MPDNLGENEIWIMRGEEQLCEMRLDWQRLFASRLTFISYLLKPVRILKIRLFLFRLESGPAEERRGECRRARQLRSKEQRSSRGRCQRLLRSWSNMCSANYRSLRPLSHLETLRDPTAEILFVCLPPSPPKNEKQQLARLGLSNECDLFLWNRRRQRFRMLWARCCWLREWLCGPCL